MQGNFTVFSLIHMFLDMCITYNAINTQRKLTVQNLFTNNHLPLKWCIYDIKIEDNLWS